MNKRGKAGRVVRMVTALAIGGSAFQIGGCDSTVRGTLLAGLETTTMALTDTLIQVFFSSLEDDAEGAGGGTAGLTTT